MRNPEKTLVVLKPDCIQRGLVGTFITAIETNGLKISDLIQKNISREEAESLYKEIRGKFHFERNVKHITSAPVIIIVIIGVDAVQKCITISESFRDNHRDVITPHRNLVHSTSDKSKVCEEITSVGLSLSEELV